MSQEAGASADAHGGAEEEAGVQSEALEPKQGSILLGIIKQLRIGMDLSRVTLPTFILEPRSFLERLCDFFAHGDLLNAAPLVSNPRERFVQVVKWYMAGWHIRPQGVKKPYNPILGEVFYARWMSEKFGKTALVAEQVSHHPPISAFYFENRQSHWFLNTHIYTRSKFLGNSAAAIMEGIAQLYFTNLDEEYLITMPTAYVRGVIVGKLLMELGDKVYIECKKTGMRADIEFKTKGVFRGTYNAIKGTISQNGEPLYVLGGKWDSAVTIAPVSDKKKEEVFVEGEKLPSQKLIVRPISEQGEWESRRLWERTTVPLRKFHYDEATKHKTFLEDNQRAAKKEREDKKIEYKQKFFSWDEETQRYIFKGLNRSPYNADTEKDTPDIVDRCLSGAFGDAAAPASSS